MDRRSFCIGAGSLVLATLGCSPDRPTSPISKRLMQFPKDRTRAASLEAAEEIAMPYQNAGVMAEFNVNWETFINNPDVITDQQFESAGAYLSSGQVDTYEADGLAVDSNLAPMYEEPYRGGLISCWKAYEAMANRCRRISSRSGRAKCWAGAMECYAACLAAM